MFVVCTESERRERVREFALALGEAKVAYKIMPLGEVTVAGECVSAGESEGESVKEGVAGERDRESRAAVVLS